MTGPDPFAGFRADLDFGSASDRTVEIVVPDASGLPEEEAGLRFVVCVGLFDMLAEAAEENGRSDEERFTMIDAALSAVEGTEPTLRYWLYEKGTKAERQELVARMRGKEVAMTREWMLPRLREDIEAYRARITALRQALEAAT